jgi:hypothetical protein
MNEAKTTVGSYSKGIKLQQKDIARFHTKIKISNDGCWNWVGGKDKDGYGMFWTEGRNMRAHRFALLSKVDPDGETDYSSMFACHTCDNTDCVNPDHLYFGTCRENILDMLKRGRGSCGEKNGNTSLTDDDVLKIRSAYRNSKVTSRQLAKQFNIGKSTVLRIIHGKSWKHINDDFCLPGVKKPDYLTFVEELFRWG